jgi:hypothetical protein
VVGEESSGVPLATHLVDLFDHLQQIVETAVLENTQDHVQLFAGKAMLLLTRRYL